MHPILGYPGRLLPYLAAWLPVAGLLGALLYGQHGISWPAAAALATPLATIYAFICLSSWYLVQYFPLEKVGAARFFPVHFAGSLASTLCWLALGRATAGVLDRLSATSSYSTAFSGSVLPLFGMGALLYMATTAVLYTIYAANNAAESARRALELEILARDAQLKALKMQISPHFLFNSLNSISALTTRDAPGARRMCLLLAAFLRRTLALGSRDRIFVREEISLLEDFIGIEKVRFGKRLEINLKVEEEALDCTVPPLVLQPLVENAINHGIAHLIEGGTVTVEARKGPEILTVVVSNPFDSEAERQSGEGIGLRNVRDRLVSAYQSDFRMNVTQEGETFRILLSLPAGTSPLKSAASQSEVSNA